MNRLTKIVLYTAGIATSAGIGAGIAQHYNKPIYVFNDAYQQEIAYSRKTETVRVTKDNLGNLKRVVEQTLETRVTEEQRTVQLAQR